MTDGEETTTDEFLVVCQYSPAGNFIGEPIYVWWLTKHMIIKKNIIIIIIRILGVVSDKLNGVQNDFILFIRAVQE